MSLPKVHTATLAGGCFWGLEELFRKLPGVLKTQVGYAGGSVSNATYDIVKSGTTGHAEAVQLEFDSTQTSFDQILDFFFRIHDPTTLNRQGGDVGSQYRSIIFFHTQDQKNIAERVRTIVNSSGAYKNPVVTQIEPFASFWLAEAEHQHYLKNYPNGYTCHFVRPIPSFLAKT